METHIGHGGKADHNVEVVPGTKFVPDADGQVESRLEMGFLDGRVWVPEGNPNNVTCTGGSYFKKLRWLWIALPYQTSGPLHRFVNKGHKLVRMKSLYRKWDEVLDWLGDDQGEGTDYYIPARCTFTEKRQRTLNYAQSQMARMRPLKRYKVPKEEMDNLYQDFWMMPRQSDYLTGSGEGPAPVVRWPSAAIQLSYSNALSMPGSFAAFNPISTNMMPEMTMPTSLIK